MLKKMRPGFTGKAVHVMQQWIVLQIFRAFQTRRSRRHLGTADRIDTLGHDLLDVDALFFPLTEAQRDINPVRDEVRLAVFGSNPDIDFRVAHTEPRQSGDQPFDGEGRQDADRQGPTLFMFLQVVDR